MGPLTGGLYGMCDCGRGTAGWRQPCFGSRPRRCESARMEAELALLYLGEVQVLGLMGGQKHLGNDDSQCQG